MPDFDPWDEEIPDPPRKVHEHSREEEIGDDDPAGDLFDALAAGGFRVVVATLDVSEYA